MSALAGLLARVYRFLLIFYPQPFRAEFAEEMCDVFTSALEEAEATDGEHAMQLFWRELRHWPGSVLRAYVRSRRRNMTTSGFGHEKPLSQVELLAGMSLFLLPLFSLIPISGSSLPQWTSYILMVLLWGCIFVGIGYAIKKRLPGWSFPYLGFALMVGLVLGGMDRIWGWIYPYFTGAFGPMSSWILMTQIIYVAVFGFILMMMILSGALVLVNMLRLLPFTRAVWGHIRADWTQLSFLLYGVLVIDILLAFDEYRYEGIWKLTACLCLAMGAWVYLKAKGQKQRILALFSGATAAKWIVVFAKWVLIPLQRWPIGYPVAPSPATRWVETSGEMIAWVWFLIMLTAPAILSFLPPPSGPAGSLEEGSITA